MGSHTTTTTGAPPGQRLALSSLVLGVLAVILWLAFFVGVLFGVAALVTGLQALTVMKYTGSETGRTQAVIGIGLGGTSVGLFVIALGAFLVLA